MINIYNHIKQTRIQSQELDIKNSISKHFFKSPSTNCDEFVPSYYILSLTPAEQRIFAYLLRFRPRGEFTQYMAEIAQATQCSIKTAQRATNKFNKDGVITKKQVIDCFDVNKFTIENKTIFDIDQVFSQKMSDININIQSIYIYKQTNKQYSRARETDVSVCQKKDVVVDLELQMNNSLKELSGKIGLTTAGKIDLIGFPEQAIKFALEKISNSSKTRDEFKVVCYYAHLWCKQNNVRPSISKVRQLSVLFNVNVDDKRIDKDLVLKLKNSPQKSIEAKANEYIPWTPKEPTKPLSDAHVMEKVRESLKTDAGKMMLSWLNVTPEQYLQNELDANNALRFKYNRWLEECGQLTTDCLSQRGIA